jgi:hypothetical protein
MQPKVIWQSNSGNPNNSENLGIIRQWWSELNSKEIAWQQRIIPKHQDVNEINWEDQKFDEKFIIHNPEVRGITLYWYKPGVKDEKNTTVNKLELDTIKDQLYIYPQSQPELVIRVGQPEIKYQTICLKDPKIARISGNNDHFILLRDADQKIEIKLTLSAQGLAKLLENLPG